jgi:hypothetical protein
MTFKNDLKVAAVHSGIECRRISKAMSRGGDFEDEYFGEPEFTFEAILYRELRSIIPTLDKLSFEPERTYWDVDLVYSPDGLLWQDEPWVEHKGRPGTTIHGSGVLTGNWKVFPVETKVVQKLWLAREVKLSGSIGGIVEKNERITQIRLNNGWNNIEPSLVVGFTGRVFEDDKILEYEKILVEELNAADVDTSGVSIIVG